MHKYFDRNIFQIDFFIRLPNFVHNCLGLNQY